MSVYDTATGKVVKEIDLASNDADVVGDPVIDQDASRAYVTTVNYADQDQNPGSVILSTYDLGSGKMLNQLTIEKMIRLSSSIPGTSPKPVHAKISNAVAAMSGDGKSLALLSWNESRLAILDIASNRLEAKPIITAQGDSCFPQGSEFFPPTELAFESGRIVTPVWTHEGEYASGYYGWVGYCSIDAGTGSAVFQPTGQIVPQGLIATIPFLSSDGERLYLAGANPSDPYGIATPTDTTILYGIFAFDAATLTSTAQWIVTASPFDIGINGYFLSETAPR